MLAHYIAEGVFSLNTTESDDHKEIETKKNHKIKIEQGDETYLITGDGTRIKVLEHLDAYNGNIYLIDFALHSVNNKNLHQLHGYGRNSISGGDSAGIYQSNALENRSSLLKINKFYLIALIALYLCDC